MASPSAMARRIFATASCSRNRHASRPALGRVLLGARGPVAASSASLPGDAGAGARSPPRNAERDGEGESRGYYAQRRSRVRSAIDGGKASERGARDQVQMIATIQGAPSRSEIPMPVNTRPACRQRPQPGAIRATSSLNLHEWVSRGAAYSSHRRVLPSDGVRAMPYAVTISSTCSAVNTTSVIGAECPGCGLIQ